MVEGFIADGALRSQRMRIGVIGAMWCAGELRVESMLLSRSNSDLTTSICSSSESASEADCSWMELVSIEVFSLSSTWLWWLCVGDELDGLELAGLGWAASVVCSECGCRAAFRARRPAAAAKLYGWKACGVALATWLNGNCGIA